MEKKIKEILMTIYYLLKGGTIKERIIYSAILLIGLTFFMKNMPLIIVLGVLYGLYKQNTKESH